MWPKMKKTEVKVWPSVVGDLLIPRSQRLRLWPDVMCAWGFQVSFESVLC